MTEKDNPYMLCTFDITNRRQYIGRDKQFEKLYHYVTHGNNAVIQGPEGTGKTQFLNCAFNKSRRRELAQRGILVAKLLFGINDEAEAFFGTIADSLVSAADILLELQDEDAQAAYRSISAAVERKRKTAGSRQGYLQEICMLLMEEGYAAYVVIDGFEQFVNSRHVTKEHHDTLRSFLANTTLRLVVATDYDFNKSTLPRHAAGSLLLQLFSGKELLLPGLSPEECTSFLNTMGSETDFSKEERTKLFQFSGGVPRLLCAAAFCAYEQRRSTGGIDWKKVRADAGGALRDLFDRWAKHLSQKEVDFLKNRARKGDLEPVSLSLWDVDCLGLLIKRGLVRDTANEEDIYLRDMYSIAAVLFRDYCRETKLTAYHDDTPDPSKPTVIVQAGANYIGDVSMKIEAKNIAFVSNGISIKELVHWIANPEQAGLATEGFQQLLGNTLKSRFTACLPENAIPQKTEEMSDYDYEVVCDEHYSAVGDKLLPSVPVNPDNEVIIDVEPEELVTIDQRFEAVRGRRSALTDEILQSQSERCRLFIKLSVIVEDALSAVGAFMEDYSPQLVLYGKALEQSLRDNFYAFFSKEERLRAYDVKTRMNDPESENTFANFNRDTTFIGSYQKLIANQVDHLSRYCVDHGISVQKKQFGFYAWTKWWKNLAYATDRVKNIRNKADHADSVSPQKGDLDKMCSELFGDKNQTGLLSSLTIGLDLWYHLNASNRTEMIHSFENTERTLVIKKIKQGNALDCRTEEGDFTVKISKSEVGKYLSEHADAQLCENQRLTAKLGVYELQDGNEFFHASIVKL